MNLNVNQIGRASEPCCESRPIQATSQVESILNSIVERVNLIGMHRSIIEAKINMLLTPLAGAHSGGEKQCGPSAVPLVEALEKVLQLIGYEALEFSYLSDRIVQ